MTLAPDFAVTGHLYMAYSKLGPEPVTAKVNRLSRFTIGADNQIVAGSEVPIYDLDPPAPGVLPHRRLARLRAGRQPLHLHGRQHEPVRPRLQPDRRAPRPPELGRAAHVGQHEQPERQDPAHRPAGGPARLAGDRDDLRHPGRQHVPGRHRPDAARDLRDGLPQPVPDHVDQKTGWVLMGDYGPDAGSDEPEPRPAGLGRVQRRQGAGLLRLALLHPRERRVQRHHLRRATPAPAPTTASTTAPRRSTTRRTTRA